MGDLRGAGDVAEASDLGVLPALVVGEVGPLVGDAGAVLLDVAHAADVVVIEDLADVARAVDGAGQAKAPVGGVVEVGQDNVRQVGRGVVVGAGRSSSRVIGVGIRRIGVGSTADPAGSIVGRAHLPRGFASQLRRTRAIGPRRGGHGVGEVRRVGDGDLEQAVVGQLVHAADLYPVADGVAVNRDVVNLLAHSNRAYLE